MAPHPREWHSLSQKYFENFIFSDTPSYSPMHILRGMGMNSFVTYTHAMIQDVQLQ
jgi:hypothetical protein